MVLFQNNVLRLKCSIQTESLINIKKNEIK